jgi:signal transduction histidine kinase
VYRLDSSGQGTLEDPADSFRQLGEVGQQALKEMRLLIHQLRPDVLQEAGLVEALRQRLDSVELRTNIEPVLVKKGNLEDLPPEIEDQLFNIAQEALNNSLRHAQANEVKVEIFEEHGNVMLSIEDNGQGFDTSLRNPGMGLQNMSERVKAIGGEFTITSDIDQGTKVAVTIDTKEKQEEHG